MMPPCFTNTARSAVGSSSRVLAMDRLFLLVLCTHAWSSFLVKRWSQDLIIRSSCSSIEISVFHTFRYAKKFIIHP
jgi:hypothetical protein